MGIFKEVRRFVVNGATVFSQAAKGEFKGNLPRIDALCHELADSVNAGTAADRANLRKDYNRISHDVGISFQKYKNAHNGE